MRTLILMWTLTLVALSAMVDACGGKAFAGSLPDGGFRLEVRVLGWGADAGRWPSRDPAGHRDVMPEVKP